MLLEDLLAAHGLRGAQLLLVAHGQEALQDLRALGERGKGAVRAEHTANRVSLRAVHRAAGEHTHRQHDAI